MTAADMAGKPLIVSRASPEPGSLFGQVISKNVAGSYSLVYNGSLMVAYMLCPDKILNVIEDSPLCFRPLIPEIKAHMSVTWKKYQVFSKPSQRFLDMLRQTLTEPEQS